MNDSLQDLAEAYIADELTDTQLTELENRIRESERERLAFLAHLEVHAGLAWESRGSVPRHIELQEERSHIIDLRRYFLPAAAAIVFLGILSWLLFRPPAAPTTIATVKASFHGQWADGGEVRTGMKLGTGTWSMQSGLAELETSSGTILLLEGPASLQLDGQLRARLLSGNVVIRMQKGESGFVLDTPRMKVTDLGTEFGVSVAADGESRVQVYDGKVRAEARGSERKELGAGETMLCSIDGSMRSAKFSEDRFIRTFPPVKTGSQAGGPLYNKSTLDAVDVIPVSAPIVIDGDLAEWNHASAFRTACEAPYDAAYFIEGMMRYDAANLYLAAHVGDPAPMKNAARPGVEFAGGSVIVRIAADRALGWPLQGTSANARSASPLPDSLNPKISSIVMWYDAKSGQPRIQLLHSFDYRTSQTHAEGWTGAFRQDANGLGYTLEYKIPWELLNCSEDPPQSGDRLAGLWMTHWSDEEGRVCRGQLVDVTNHQFSSSGIAPYVFFQNGPSWGRMNFLPAK